MQALAGGRKKYYLHLIKIKLKILCLCVVCARLHCWTPQTHRAIRTDRGRRGKRSERKMATIHRMDFFLVFILVIVVNIYVDDTAAGIVLNYCFDLIFCIESSAFCLVLLSVLLCCCCIVFDSVFGFLAKHSATLIE